MHADKYGAAGAAEARRIAGRAALLRDSDTAGQKKVHRLYFGATIVLVPALVVVLAGCSSSERTRRNAERAVRDNAIEVELEGQLEKTPGVVKVDVRYCYGSLTCSGDAGVSLTVEPGSNLEQIADLAVGAIWRSPLDPLEAFTVNVGSDTQDGRPFVRRNYTILHDRAELEAKWGHRPAHSG